MLALVPCGGASWQSAGDNASAADEGKGRERLVGARVEMTRVARQNREVGTAADLEPRIGWPAGVGSRAERHDAGATELYDVRVATRYPAHVVIAPERDHGVFGPGDGCGVGFITAQDDGASNQERIAVRHGLEATPSAMT